MSIKQQGGIFGRNPTFNDVTVDGTLTTSGALSFDELNVDNININGNTISSTDTDGNVTVDPNGTGALVTSGADIVARDTGNNELKIKAKSGGGDARTAEIFSGASVPTTDVALGGLRFYNALSGISDDIVCQIVAKRGTNNNNAYLDFSTSQGGRSDQMRLQHNGNLSMTGGGNITFNSGSGIDFSATSGTGTSELFDDYEEGTWTPVVWDGTNEASMAANAGWYTKIGNIVTIGWNSYFLDVSGLTAGSQIRIKTLPFTAGDKDSWDATNFSYNASGKNYFLRVPANGTEIYFYASDTSATDSTALARTTMASATHISFFGTHTYRSS